MLAGEGLIAPTRSIFGRASVWRAHVTGRPVSKESGIQINGLTARLARLYNGNAAFSVYQYGVAWVTVSADQPTTTVKWDDCQGKNRTPDGLFGPAGQFERVPIPDVAVPSPGTDAQLTIYQPSTDTLWDFWRAYHATDGWHACWGGRIDDASADSGVFPFPFGASASGLARSAGAVSINDVRSGRIEHAIALSVPRGQVAREPVRPANRSDGENVAADAIPEGARLRLDPEVRVESLELSPIGAMVARAAQTYGFIVTDCAGTLSVPAENPGVYQRATGIDPWALLLGGLRPSAVLANFPWDDVEGPQPAEAAAPRAAAIGPQTAHEVNGLPVRARSRRLPARGAWRSARGSRP